MTTDTLPLRIAHWFDETQKLASLLTIRLPQLPDSPDLDSPAITAETSSLLRDRGWKS